VNPKLTLLLAAGVLLVSSCGPNYAWTPHKLAYEHQGRQQTFESVLIYDGDLEALIRANAVLMGSLRAASAETARKTAARCRWQDRF
jgi:hypothetical protein